MNSLKYSYFAPLAGILATLFLLSGCFQDAEKTEAQRQERLERAVFAIHEAMLVSGDADRAIAELEKLDKKSPDSVVVVSGLGRAYAEKGDPLMAAFYFDYALELDPEQAEWALLAATAHLGSGNKAEAAEAYRGYLRLNAEAADIWHKLALLEMEQDNFQPALSAYLEALRLSGTPPSAEDKLHLARLYHSLGNPPQAQRWYADLLAEQGLDRQLRIDGMVGQFDLLLRQKQWDEALALMYALDEFAPNTLQDGPYAAAYTELAQWDKQRKARAAEQQKAEAAKAEALKAAELAKAAEPAQAGEQAKAGELAQTGEQAKTGERTKDAGEALAPEATKASEAVAAAQAGKAAEAETAAGQAQSLAEAVAQTAVSEPASAETVVEAETAWVEKSGKIEGITADAGEVEIIAPAESQTDGAVAGASGAAQASAAPSAGAAASVAVGADASAQGGDASAQGENALAQGEDAAAQAQDASAAALAEQGRKAFEAEDYATAAELLERSVKLNPGNAEVLDMLSRACFRTERYLQAERFAALATYAAPKNVNYRLEYLRAYQRNNPPPSMLQQLITAKEDFPGDPSVTLALARGYEYIAQRKALAADLYHEYLKLAPDAPQAAAIRQKLLEWEM